MPYNDKPGKFSSRTRQKLISDKFCGNYQPQRNIAAAAQYG